MNPAKPAHRYWRQTLALTGVLVMLWLVLTACVALWTPDPGFSFFGWPFGFWGASQGAPLLYCAIVWAYALLMDRLERPLDDGGGD